MTQAESKQTVVLGITSEACRQNALATAIAMKDTTSATFTFDDTAKLAAVGTMWSTLGLLCVALGDPDKGKQ